MNPIARTILSQLGDNRFIAMTGAREFVQSENSLRFRLPARFAAKGINIVRVTLQPSDTYSVEFFKARGVKCDKVSEADDVYAENLREVFTERTGLDCAL